MIPDPIFAPNETRHLQFHFLIRSPFPSLAVTAHGSRSVHILKPQRRELRTSQGRHRSVVLPKTSALCFNHKIRSCVFLDVPSRRPPPRLAFSLLLRFGGRMEIIANSLASKLTKNWIIFPTPLQFIRNSLIISLPLVHFNYGSSSRKDGLLIFLKFVSVLANFKGALLNPRPGT